MRVTSVEQMHEEARAFLKTLAPSTDAVVVGLRGDLGSGKTTFVKGLAEALRIHESITSPTFVIFKRFVTGHDVFQTLLHVDAYRLEGEKDIRVLGWNEYIQDGAALICVEWPECIEGALPPHTIYIDFKFIDEHTRDITFNGKA